MVEFPGGLLVKDLALSWIKKKKKKKPHKKTNMETPPKDDWKKRGKSDLCLMALFCPLYTTY